MRYATVNKQVIVGHSQWDSLTYLPYLDSKQSQSEPTFTDAADLPQHKDTYYAPFTQIKIVQVT